MTVDWRPREARRMQWLEEAAKWGLTRMGSDVPSAPACITGIKTFSPGVAQTVDPDYDNDTESIQLFAPTGTTYDIVVPHNSPGVFVAWDIAVTVYYTEQKVVVTNQPKADIETVITMGSNEPVKYNNGTSDADYTTQKYLRIPLQVQSLITQSIKSFNYFWNLRDPRSGRQLSDQLLPDVCMLPPISPIPRNGLARGEFNGDGWMRFDAPLVMERDSELVFQWRPIVELYQLASNTTPTTVSVRVDIHGIKYFFDRDFLNQGATFRRQGP